MNEKILSEIRGERISYFSLVKFGHLDYNKSVALHLESGPVFEIKCREFKFGRYEADTLGVTKHQKKPKAEVIGAGWTVDTIKAGWTVDTIKAGWTVGAIEATERQDWLEPSPKDTQTVGNNPTMHAWGPIGYAPKAASHTTIVISSIVFASDSRDNQAMVSLVDYPGVVRFTTSACEIDSMRKVFDK